MSEREDTDYDGEQYPARLGGFSNSFHINDEQKNFLKSSIKMRMMHSKVGAVVSEGSESAILIDLTNVAENKGMAAISQQRFLSSDLVRTKQFDSSSKQMNPSLLRGPVSTPSSYQEINREEYCAPCDRVGRFYTKSAAGLTLKQAAKVAKQMTAYQIAPKKVIGFALAATAPDAFRATQRIAEIAETGKMPQKQKRKQTTISIPSSSSSLALREGHRLIRSEPMYNIIKPTPLPRSESNSPQLFMESRSSTPFEIIRNFNAWDPESLDDINNEKEVNDKVNLSPEMLLELKSNAIEKFTNAVDLIVRSGVLTAGGSGNRSQLPPINHMTLNSIIARVPSITGFLGDHYMQHLLAQELSNVQDAYYKAAAKACVEYDVKDPIEALNIGINTLILYDNSHHELWTNKEYQVFEWKVQRQTKVSTRKVLRTYRIIDKALRNSLQTMMEIHYLWLDDTLPRLWWEGETGLERCPYGGMLFTDVNQPSFQLKMPMLLGDFVSHVEGHSKDIRDALLEFWIVSVGNKLSGAISRLKVEKSFIDTEKSDNDFDREKDKIHNNNKKNKESDNDSDDDDDSQMSGEYKKFQRALKNRIVLEEVEEQCPYSSRNSSKGVLNVPKDTKGKNSAERLVSSAVVLLSRQLRVMCESSLQSMSELFEKLSRPSTSEYSVFVINMRLRRRRTGELTGEFTEPVYVSLSPDILEIKSAMTSCIQKLVNASRGFPRPEQGITQTFGGKNNHMVANMINSTRNKKMNESSVHLQDEIVTNVMARIHKETKDYYEGPMKLLEGFETLEGLLSGVEADKVIKAIQDCVGPTATSSDTLQNLENLTAVCNDLESMINSIKSMAPDISNFPLYEVRCIELKDLLIKQVRYLHSLILEAVADENRLQMLAISSKYQEIANTLVAEATDSAELKALQEYTIKAATILANLHEQYVTQCYERVKFLLMHKFKMIKEDIQILYTTFNWPGNIQSYLRRSYEAQSARKKELEELLEEDQRKLENDMHDIAKRVESLADNPAPMEFRKNVDRIAAIKRDLDAKKERAEEISVREILLEMPQSDFLTRLDETRAQVEPLDRLWNTVKMFVEKTHHWQESPLTEIDPEDAQRTSEDIHRSLMKLTREFDKGGEKRSAAKRIAESLQNDLKEFMEDSIPLMLLICNPGMQERHWEEVENITGVSVPKGGNYTLSMMTEIGLQNHVKDMEDICVSASKEHNLQVAMDKMENEWKNMAFDTKEYRNSGTRVLSSTDEIQQLLDDQIVKTQSMKGSRFIGPFLERITIWEDTLVTLQDVLDNWIKVQSTWLYLEPIFSSDDIMRQMPAEGKMFQAVDSTWRSSMALTHSEPSCIKVARRQGFLQSLAEANSKLEQIQKGLNDYLETKRLAFSRFFFLSNDELLEILAETKDPLRVQPHLKKCFDGIAKLHFEKNLDITGCYDPKGERLDFPYEKIKHKRINPNSSSGNVENWLIEVEIVMKKSLAYSIDYAMKDFTLSDRIEWLQRWQGQVLICVNQTKWCVEVESCLKSPSSSTGWTSSLLEAYYEKLCTELMRTVELVRGDISKSLRVSIGALVVMDVHNRDTVQEMVSLGITSRNEFDWLSQLRYYWNNDNISSQTGKPSTIQCKMINAIAYYAYEYIGNQDRLVITPLTDRCYRTLMGAIYLNLGGAPEGPAGTGKTETTKDLAKAIAIQCVVTNCSDGLDYLAMAKFFKGLASSGAWACFDEFNRIQLEVLSVVAQQIMQIQLAKIKGVEKFFFEGTELILRPTCCPFITMNPGYAGRAELPDNLKVLFRTVAMMVPDYAMISEIILYSYGYKTAKPLAIKIVTTYKLCSEQLSSQSHYDYGMRAVIAVLRAAGNLKRSDGHLPEDVLVLRSIIDVNLPKFLSPDVPLFNGITSDLFPGVQIEEPDTINMKQAFIDVCHIKKLIPVDYFWNKVIQIYDMMVVRHGFMIVGLPYSGKSSAWKVLCDMLGLLYERYPNDKRWSKVLPVIQNPKSITMGQLYGQFDPASHEWADGVLAINYRNAASNRIGTPEDRKWIIFDGPVDAIWIENMNTVLDDNKKLCLMSGEIIAMTDVMSMIFEPMDLLVASPATVSRCGMIYLEPEQLGWNPLLAAWLETNKKFGDFCEDSDKKILKFSLSNSDVDLIRYLFDWLVEPCLCFVRKEIIEMSPTVDSNLIMSLLNIFESLLVKALMKYDILRDDELSDIRHIKQKIQDIECCFIQSLVWSVGKSGTALSQIKFSTFLNDYINNINCLDSEYLSVLNVLETKKWQKPEFNTINKGILSLPMPIKIDYYECVYIPEESKWRYWYDLLPTFIIPPNTVYNNIIVPNNCTAQFSYMLELLIPHKKNILICGPTGTGKSIYINNIITGTLPQNKYKALCLGFSAKTSANMTQDIIDGKLDKRRKGVYGPPVGQQTIIFVDDLNMPEIELYGAQPPLELLRQLADNNGWYDLKEKTWRNIVDTSLIAAMGPPGGGRNDITPRLLRHFNLLCFSEFDDNTLKRIFSTIVQWHFQGLPFPAEVRGLSDIVVEATLEVYRIAMITLLPTPSKSHYTFNLRDFSRIIQGILLCRPDENFNRSSLIKLWCHESLRVLGDRLVDSNDKNWYHNQIGTICYNRFNISLNEIFQHIATGPSVSGNNGKKIVTANDMRNCIFGDFMTDNDNKSNNNKEYKEIENMNKLNKKMENYLIDYNQSNRKPMNLVMFSFAVEHISRVSRILKMGNGLLAGVGGSGRQSVTRLAAHINGFKTHQIEITKNYRNTDWREDLKLILKEAGTEITPIVFLFSDTQIKNETFVEDINNILNNGEVPNIFPNDERALICEAVRPFARQIYGKIANDMTNLELYAYFIKRVKQNLHIILAFSPIGDAFRDRLRKFPALINCCTIDWFTAWPSDALVAVAKKFLADVKFENDDMRNKIVILCQSFHEDVIGLSERFMSSLKRRNYVTPTSYLELIIAFTENLDKKRIEISQQRMRYVIGLEKLAFAANEVNTMQKQLADLQPELIESAGSTEILMRQIEEKMPGVLETRRIVTAEAAVAQREADVVQKQKNEVEVDLAVAIPALEEAIAALNTIKPNDINEMKALSKPPEKIKMVCRAVCIMLDIKAVRIPDPNDPSKRIMDYWGPSQKMLSDSQFINKLIDYDKDNMLVKIVNEIKKDYIEHPDFNPDVISKASRAAEGMCRWCFAMITYDRIAKIVAPKKVALELAEITLNITMRELNNKKLALKRVEDDLITLQSQLLAAKQKKTDLENQAHMCDIKITRANQLLEGLGGEKDRWGDFAQQLLRRYNRLTGDVLVSAGLIAYLGPFTAVYRQEQMKSWVLALREFDIPCSELPTLSSTLGDAVRIRRWNIEGLPTDSFSVDNGIIVFSARRWPLIIDPQGQANKWIRNMEKLNNLQVIKLTDFNFLRTLENSIQFGNPVLLENIGEDLDPSLEPLLQKQLFKQGGINCIRLGDTVVEYSENFRFYMTTKLRNPHYLPEVSVKVTLLNFMITPEGLQDQLLGIVVSQERPDLEEQRNALIVESANNKKLLQEIEDKILKIMSSSSGNILEDETAITTLKNSKTLSDEITVKQHAAEETETNINNVRQSYFPVAYSSQILFFCIADLANIEPVYQYSLTWFINLFVSSIKKSDKGRDLSKRLENLDTHFAFSLYRNVCRSLLEKDKLLFSFLLTSRIMAGKGEIDPNEWFFLLTGGIGTENLFKNPAPKWLNIKCWESICRLSEIKKYSNFREDFCRHLIEWEKIYDSLSPQNDILPGMFADENGLGKLCVLRTIRPDKVIMAVQNFVILKMGRKYVEPPSFDLQSCYSDSSPIIPLIFILSSGSDPMNAVFRAAELLKTTVDPISLGQGQGPKAAALIEKAKQKGTWVVLQNCHLAPSWMNTLERICEEFDIDEINPSFRLWCTTYPSEVFPISVLQNGVKMTNEPPKGIRANLLGSWNSDPLVNPTFFSSCKKGIEFRKLVFGLTFFHAVVQERRLYGPLGWNIPYEFNESDMKISMQQLVLFLDENDTVPFKAILYTAGECNYGGRVTDDKDRRTLMCILKRFYSPEFLEESHNISSTSDLFQCPTDGNREHYIEFINTLPLIAPPEIFGLHDNATLTRGQNDTLTMLNNILDTENGGSNNGNSIVSKDDIIAGIASEISSKIPLNFDMEYAILKFPVRWEESMNTVLCQELVRFNNLLNLMRDSLINLIKAVKGLVVMSSDLEILGNSLNVNRMPNLWKKRSYPSLKTLSAYISDQQARLAFFTEWLLHTSIPTVFWLSSFFFTQAFLTGAAQNFARKYTIPIDDVVFDFEMMAEEKYEKGPDDGVYTYGLFLEGARWDFKETFLAESYPKILFSQAPTMLFKPYRKADVPEYPHYKCPVYKTSDRRGILATTGHSSNFVCFINMPSNLNEDHWVERGVAMLTQLDD